MKHKCGCKNKKCRGPRGCRGPEGLIGSTGPTGNTGPVGPTGPEGRSGSFDTAVVPFLGIRSVETEIGHYIRVGNVIFATVKARNVVTIGRNMGVFIDGLPFFKDTTVFSGEGVATGARPIDPNAGTLSGVSLSDTGFLITYSMNDTDSGTPENPKTWQDVAFSFSYVTDQP